MPGCNCPGQSCSCAIQAGPGVNVTGTGSAAAPFIIGLDARAVVIEQAAAGALDLTPYAGVPVITVNMSASITDMTLPDLPGTEVELFLMLTQAGSTVAWPSGVRWVDGVAPVAASAVGKARWVRLRQTAGFWAGEEVGEV